MQDSNEVLASVRNHVVELLSDEQLAPKLNVSVGFLRKDRRGKRRVPFIRLGDRCLYDLNRVHAALLNLEEGGAAKRSRKT